MATAMEPGGEERPHVHFTPPRGWLSDPNGLVHLDGTFHLFYQHHPHDTSWGPMHWGHAVSTDLVSWHHRPVALVPDERGQAYSGSAVVDRTGTAGVGPGALVLAYTRHRADAPSQALAWSRDGGRTFTVEAEPVLVAPPGQRDFRDPRVLRHGGPSGHWVMLVAAGHAVCIYTSADLRSWSHTSTVRGVFAGTGVWEMPELLAFDVEGTEVWLLVVSVWDGAPAGGGGVQAVAGSFDGATFIPRGQPWWVDCGPAFYAPQGWTDAPGGRRIWVGWQGNWHTVNDLPATGWRGQMSVPRELALRRFGDRYRLVQTPVAELVGHRRPPRTGGGAIAASCLEVVAAPPEAGETLELDLRRDHQVVSVRVGVEDGHVEVVVSDGADRRSYEGRLATGEVDPPVRVLCDTASVEVFAGSVTVSVLLTGRSEPWSVSEPARGTSARSVGIEVHALGS